jgi:hypothetical protein
VAGPGAVPDALRAGLAVVGLFLVCGFALVRLLLPDGLRPYELLLVLPVGACAAAVELAVLGYVHVPLAANVAVVLGANVVAAVVAVRRVGWPRLPARGRLGEVGWPLWIALIVACVALVPMFRAGFAVVQGYGSDAHLAVGTADFLKHHPPGVTSVEGPVDQVPLVWRSKPPIYYPMAAVSALSGMETWQVMAPLMAVLLAMSAAGFFLLARTALGAGLAGAVVAMAAVGLDRVALHTTMHPYYNQLWGFFTLPFAILLAYWAARSRTRGAYALLVLMLVVGALAYPLAVPIPLIALVALLWPERGRLRGLWRWWMLIPALILFAPLLGVVEKAVSSLGVVLDPGRSLRSWGGDLLAFVPEHQFVSLPSSALLLLLGPFFLAAIVWELRRQPRGLALALGGVLLFGVLAAAWFRPRDYGWYFHFKALAFVGPLAVLLAVVAVSRLRKPFAAVALGACVLFAVQGARDEVVVLYDQTPRQITELRAEVDERLPPDASIRLDMDGNQQLWAAYFLSGQPLCSSAPLLDTSYPHVPMSLAADYAVIDNNAAPRGPSDAAGGPLWEGEQYSLYRLKPRPGEKENCSRRMVQTVTSVPLN